MHASIIKRAKLAVGFSKINFTSLRIVAKDIVWTNLNTSTTPDA
jgi:hypothetical protein